MKKYYCTEHSFDRSRPLKENKGLCQVVGGCGMIACFEIEEPERVSSNYPIAAKNLELNVK